MKTKTHTLAASVLALAATGLCSLATAAPAPFLALPTPENNPNAIYSLYPDGQGALREAILLNGIPIAFKYDDFWSYSAKVLDAIQGQTAQTDFLPTAIYGVYDFSVGTGNIAVNITSNAGGATNVNPNGSGVTMQDPADLNSSSSIYGWTCNWGGLTQSCTNFPTDPLYSKPAAGVNGTTTVGELLTYLQSLNPLASVPVLYADYNQTGVGDSLWFGAKVQIFDATGTTLKAEWQLDRVANNTWDQAAPTFNYGNIAFYGDQASCEANPYDLFEQRGCAGWTANGDEYLNIDHNTGSGKPDMLAYAPDMDLKKFLASDLFVVTGNLGCIQNADNSWLVAPLRKDGQITDPANKNDLGCNTNGGEEFGIVGALAPEDRKIPEPSTLLLTSLGLLGFLRLRRTSRLPSA
ncbi:PEP-CTERM sorting domain-containing protein [Zoogloea sp.]|uniref:PEP-CTERM sorting domain-containing protein n=1 Tax=Zoogloea sp. TaxID=49181 RepID=UPI0026332542|nr:PEP-CTERM sorting domain-containing protein [Zoogloea sp.]MDD3352313.1 PEP-CTERM sorting domain-containing protein [Zoogloea sp.]